jgi:hypothetical protein
MNTANVASIAATFDNQILSTLNTCLIKISDKLKNSFDPDDAKSVSLFRQFCSAINAHIKWTKIIQKSQSNSSEPSKKVSKRSNHKNISLPLPLIKTKTKKATTNGVNQRSSQQYDHLFPPKEQPSGLLYRA